MFQKGTNNKRVERKLDGVYTCVIGMMMPFSQINLYNFEFMTLGSEKKSLYHDLLCSSMLSRYLEDLFGEFSGILKDTLSKK